MSNNELLIATLVESGVVGIVLAVLVYQVNRLTAIVERVLEIALERLD